MKIVSTLGAVAVSAICCGNAFAADLGARPIYSPPPVQPGFTWTGLYLGVHGGWGWGDGRISGGSGTVDLNGEFLGGQIGYNWQAGNWVLGVEVDSAWADIGKTNSFGFAGGTFTADTNIDYIGTARGRIGYAQGNVLLYGTGGAAWAHNDISLTAVVPPFTAGVSSSNTHVGWTAGAGVEWAFVPNWSAKLEYLYADFGGQTYFSGVAGGFNADAKISTVKLGFNYLFR